MKYILLLAIFICFQGISQQLWAYSTQPSCLSSYREKPQKLSRSDYSTIIAETLSSLKKINNVKDRDKLLLRFTRVMKKHSDPEGILTVVQNISEEFQKKNSALVLHHLTVAKIKTSDKEGAFTIAQNMKEDLSQRRIWIGIAIALAEVGDIEGAWEVVQKIQTEYRKLAVIGIAKAQVDANDVEGALVTIQQLEGAIGEFIADIVIAQAKADDVKGAFVTLRKIAITDHRNRAKALVGILMEHVKVGRVAEVLATIKTFEELWPNSYRHKIFYGKYVYIVNAHNIMLLRFKKSCTVLEKYGRVCVSGNLEPQNLPCPDISTLIAESTAIVEKTKIKVFKRSGGVTIRPQPAFIDLLLGNIAVAQVRADDMKGALATLQKVSRPSERYEALVIISGIKAFLNDEAETLKIIQNINDSYYMNKVLTHVAIGKARRGNVASALEKIQKINPDSFRRKVAIRRVAVAVAESNMEDAEAKAWEIAKMNERHIDKTKAFIGILKIKARTGNIEDIQTTIKTIEKLLPDTYNDKYLYIAEALLNILDKIQVSEKSGI